MEQRDRTEYFRQYRAKNKEKLKEYYKGWCQENKEKFVGYHKKYMDNPQNRAKVNEGRRRKYHSNLNLERESARVRQATYRARKMYNKEKDNEK